MLIKDRITENDKLINREIALLESDFKCLKENLENFKCYNSFGNEFSNTCILTDIAMIKLRTNNIEKMVEANDLLIDLLKSIKI